jgi:hypothetical protein
VHLSVKPSAPVSSSFAYRHHAFFDAILSAMRTTLRRSCDACARSKLRCDLLTPLCSRCNKTNKACVYANEPLSSSPSEHNSIASAAYLTDQHALAVLPFSNPSVFTHNPGVESFDPFDTYPTTRLPKAQVQRLIQHCKKLRRVGRRRTDPS